MRKAQKSNEEHNSSNHDNEQRREQNSMMGSLTVSLLTVGNFVQRMSSNNDVQGQTSEGGDISKEA